MLHGFPAGIMKPKPHRGFDALLDSDGVGSRVYLALSENQAFSAMFGSLFAAALNSTIAIEDDKHTCRALNTPLRVNVHNRTSITEATFIPTAFNEYSENFRNSGATNSRTTTLVRQHTTTLMMAPSRNAAAMNLTVRSLMNPYPQPKAENHGNNRQDLHQRP